MYDTHHRFTSAAFVSASLGLGVESEAGVDEDEDGVVAFSLSFGLDFFSLVADDDDDDLGSAFFSSAEADALAAADVSFALGAEEAEAAAEVEALAEVGSGLGSDCLVCFLIWFFNWLMYVSYSTPFGAPLTAVIIFLCSVSVVIVSLLFFLFGGPNKM